jgi:large subunit ribosomal protein L2
MILTYARFFSRSGGRNNTGRTTVRHRGGALLAPRASIYPRYSNFFVSKYRAFSLQHLSKSALGLCFKLSANSYNFGIIPNKFSEPTSFLRFGNHGAGVSFSKLYTVPLGTKISHLQLFTNTPAKVARAPGSFAQVLKRRGSFVTLKMPSGEIRRVGARCIALSSTLLPRAYFLPKFTKAGDTRKLGWRPHVRGCAMNPVDHPHGGRTGESRPSVSPWGILTKGYKTRTKPINKRLVLKSVQQLKVNI